MAGATLSTTTASLQPGPLTGTRILSLALNLPGPAALMRCQQMGATCTKLEPPAPETTATTSSQPAGTSADPMALYCPSAYQAMHHGVQVLQAHLKTEAGQKTLHQELVRSDVLITSFRPSALTKLGLDWEGLHARYPRLSLVRIVGSAGLQAEDPGHDLTYMAQAGLLQGFVLPPTLYADMGGALLTSEAVLQALLLRAISGQGSCLEVALDVAAHWLALPRNWGLTVAGGDVGGAHAGYQIYPCRNGRVVLAALEPHFAKRLCAAAALPAEMADDMHAASSHAALGAFFASQEANAIEQLAKSHDLPLVVLEMDADSARAAVS